jgi:hypothetical protein
MSEPFEAQGKLKVRPPKSEDAGLPDKNRRDPHKPGESPALHNRGRRRRLGRAEPGLYMGSKGKNRSLAALGPETPSGMLNAQMTSEEW